MQQAIEHLIIGAEKNESSANFAEECATNSRQETESHENSAKNYREKAAELRSAAKALEQFVISG